MLLARVVCVNHHVFGGDVFGTPLDGTGGSGHLLPLVLEQHFEVAHVPLGGVGFPGAFEATGGGVAAFACAVAVDPAKAHFLDGRTLWLWAHFGCIACAVHLAEGVTTSDQGHGFVVVHGHAGECLTHVLARQHGVGVAIRTLWVHIDQTHLHSGQRAFELAFTGIAAVGLVAGGQPLFLRTPVDVFLGRPDVGTSAAKTKGLEAHGFHGHVAAQHKQVGPRDLVAVLLLDGPQQAAALVEVAVVWPAVDGGKALVAGACTATAVGCAVGACCVPSQANEQTTVVTVVSGPPLLVLSHQVGQIFLQRDEVNFLEFFLVIEVRTHGVGHRLMLVQDGQVQLIGPPVRIGPGAMLGACATACVERTLP